MATRGSTKKASKLEVWGLTARAIAYQDTLTAREAAAALSDEATRIAGTETKISYSTVSRLWQRADRARAKITEEIIGDLKQTSLLVMAGGQPDIMATSDGPLFTNIAGELQLLYQRITQRMDRGIVSDKEFAAVASQGLKAIEIAMQMRKEATQEGQIARLVEAFKQTLARLPEEVQGEILALLR